MERFCKDCRHSRGESDALECESPQNGIDSVDHALFLVTGIPQLVVRAKRSKMCRVLRSAWPKDIMPTICGPEGKWFEGI